ncbi:FAD-dependent oxidoreductase [Chitinophaga sp. 30R24]|uniref:FAD-dependent oxidoreductase n=1 Tax=Chitinophaga sp. 30R24 TaxID=3248838 RepID=UPI003B916DFD
MSITADLNLQGEKRMRVIVAGGGIVGLTVGLALRAIGAEVLICEQSPEIRAAGASIGLWKNALEVFAEFGVGDQINAIGTQIEAWFYDASGNRFRAPGFDVADHSFLLVPRPALNTLLADAAGSENIKLNSRIVGFEEHEEKVSVRFANGDIEDADLLIGADGVYSVVRNRLVPGYPAKEHRGHHVWRAMIPSCGEPAEGSILTVGHYRTRGGYSRTYGGQVTWMVNQFESEIPTGTKKEEALRRAANLNDESLIKLIESTPEEAILHNQIMFVPPLPRWVSARVALIGDAAHGLSPHISAGGTLGIEDVRVLVHLLKAGPDIQTALRAYEANRIPHYQMVHRLSLDVEHSVDAREYARFYATFSHWMLNEGSATNF